MSNLEKIIKYAAQEDYTKFKSVMNTEISDRILKRIQDNKESVAEKIFGEEN